MSEQRIVRRSLARKTTAPKADWSASDTLTDADISAAVRSDPDAAPILDSDWFKAARIATPEKEAISIRLDKDVLEFFKALGPRYQTRINAVLRAFMEQYNTTTR
jgi:uncharacterized protein (DUF4415 family)